MVPNKRPAEETDEETPSKKLIRSELEKESMAERLREIENELFFLKAKKPLIFSLKHEHILSLYSHEDGQKPQLFAPERFHKTLSSECQNVGSVWIYHPGVLMGRKKITLLAFTNRIKTVIVAAIKVALFFRTRNISHGGLGNINNYVFSLKFTPKIQGLGMCSVGSDVYGDLRDIATLIENILHRSGMDLVAAPLELRSLILLLKYFPKDRDPAILLGHPALLNASERHHFALAASVHLKRAEENCIEWETFCSNRGNINKDWPRVVLSRAPFLAGKRFSKYDDYPARLVHFTRHKYSHMYEICQVLKKGRLRFTENKLEETFLDLFPRLFVEFFIFRHALEGPWSRYW